MLKNSFENLNICLIGFNNILGKIFIKQLTSYFNFNQTLYIVELKSDESKRQKFVNDTYFSQNDKKFIKTNIRFIHLNQLAMSLPKIDLLLNFFIPLDFSQFQKAMDYHVLKTKQICNQLKKIQITKILMVSSVYSQNPGYINEADQLQQYIIEPPHAVAKQSLNIFIKQSFASYRQCWQWSIKYIQKQYAKITQSIQIVRVPSLGPTLNYYEGYSDKFNYFTYFIYLMGTGFFQSVNGKPQNIIDLLPADYLFNYLMVLAYKKQNIKSRIHNLSTSSRNPISIQKLLVFFSQAWQEYQNKFVQLKLNNKKWQKRVQNWKQQLPLKVKNRLSVILDIKQWKIQSQQQNIALQKKRTLAAKYQYFLEHQWICESNYSIDLMNSLEQSQKQRFNFNVNNINWKTYCRLCCYSIKKYLLNQHVQEFQPSTLDLLKLEVNHSYFSDIIWALKQGKVVNSVNHLEIKNYILSTKSVKEAIKSLVEQRMLKLENDPISYQKAEEQLYKVADQMCIQMFSQYNMKSIRLFAWFLHKVFKTIYEKVVVDKQALLKLRNHNQKQLGPLIIIPTHRSYIDFLIMGYVFFGYTIKLPHIAAAEDFLNMAIVHILLRQSGAFFIKRNQQKNRILYKAIMQEYITKVLSDAHYLQFFIEGTRCRVGKMLPPKYGILSIVAKNVLEGKIPDAQILPVTLNYEKVLEGQSFTYEMMGQSKVKQSLARLIKAADTLKQNYGRIYIQFSQTISVKKYFATSNLSYQKTLQNFGYEIVHNLTDNLVMTAPAIIATVVLMFRKGISDDTLSDKVMWLCKQIASRGIKIARSQSDNSISISNTLTLMSDIVQKSKKNMFQVQVSLEQESFVKLFLMTYYRNTLTHIFWQQSLIMISLASFGHQTIMSTSVTIDLLFNQTKFLDSLLKKQYVMRYSLQDKNRFIQVLKILQSKKVIKIQDQSIVLGPEGQPQGNFFVLYGSLIWPVIQSYWITCLYLFKLKNQKPTPMQKFLTEIQWFAQSLINERIITHHESISIDTIKNAVSTFTSLKVIKNFNHTYNDGTKVSSVALNVDENVLKKLQEKIQIFLKKSYAKSVKGILQSGQGSVNLDFPFLSKL